MGRPFAKGGPSGPLPERLPLLSRLTGLTGLRSKRYRPRPRLHDPTHTPPVFATVYRSLFEGVQAEGEEGDDDEDEATRLGRHMTLERFLVPNVQFRHFDIMLLRPCARLDSCAVMSVLINKSERVEEVHSKRHPFPMNPQLHISRGWYEEHPVPEALPHINTGYSSSDDALDDPTHNANRPILWAEGDDFRLRYAEAQALADRRVAEDRERRTRKFEEEGRGGRTALVVGEALRAVRGKVRDGTSKLLNRGRGKKKHEMRTTYRPMGLLGDDE